MSNGTGDKEILVNNQMSMAAGAPTEPQRLLSSNHWFAKTTFVWCAQFAVHL